jgi:hypothetical protein
MRATLLLGFCLFLGACEKPIDSATETPDSADALQPIVPDTTSWPDVIGAGMGYFYRQQPSLCVASGRGDRGSVGFLEPDKSARHLFRTYFIKPEVSNSSGHLEQQLRLLVQHGLLRTRPITVVDAPQIGYLFTHLGWALSPPKRSQSLCFSTGVSQVSHITDYTPVHDQHSGLVAYQVEYERGPLYLDWFDAELRSAFPDYKMPSPTLHKALLVKGPKGYFFAAAAIPKTFPRPKLPTREQARRILLEGGIVDRICQIGACDEAAPGKLKVLTVGSDSRSSAKQVKFSYELGAKGTLLASIHLGRNADGRWDTSRASYHGKVQPPDE